MITIKTTLEDGQDLENWAKSNGWCIDDEITKLDDQDRWQEAFDAFDYTECESKTALNDLIRFGLDDIEFFKEENEEESEDEEENDNRDDLSDTALTWEK